MQPHTAPTVPEQRANAMISGLLALVALLVASAAACSDGAAGGADAAGSDAEETVDVAGELTQTTACAACNGGCVEEAWTYGPAYHETAPIQYAETPPSGGPHDGCWYAWGRFDVAVPARRFVHNLEHGGLVLAYDCADGCAADVTALEAAAKASGLAYIVTPFAGMPRRLVALCWNHRLLLDCVDEAAIVAFAKAYCPLAPEQFPDDPSPSCMP